MTDIPAVVQQQVAEFRDSLAGQPMILESFDALLPRVIDAVVADLDHQVDADTAKLPLGGVAASLIKGAIAAEAARVQAEAEAWLAQNLPQGAT